MTLKQKIALLNAVMTGIYSTIKNCSVSSCTGTPGLKLVYIYMVEQTLLYKNFLS